MTTVSATDPMDPVYLSDLRTLVRPEAELRNHGYITEPLTEAQLLQRRRCRNCSKTIKSCMKNKRENAGDEEPPAPTAGPFVGQQGQAFEDLEPCKDNKAHDFGQYTLQYLATKYQMYKTPDQPLPGSDIRAAVAIDCKTGVDVFGDQQVIRVSLVDFFTGAPLIDHLVFPDEPLRTSKPDITGITFDHLQSARSMGTCYLGQYYARLGVWHFVGKDTVVVGHSLQNDMRALKWVHTRVVDAYIIEFPLWKKRKEEEEEWREWENIINPIPKQTQKPKAITLSLKSLTKWRLGREIQKTVHNGVEDAVAARDLVVLYILEKIPGEEEGEADEPEEPPNLELLY